MPRKTQPKPPKPSKPAQPNAPDFTGCKTCAYYSSGVNGRNQNCNYMAYTGKPRGCPAGAGCIRHATKREAAKPQPPIRQPVLTALERQAHQREAQRAARHFVAMTQR